jgi:hypothetical protein
VALCCFRLHKRFKDRSLIPGGNAFAGVLNFESNVQFSWVARRDGVHPQCD